MSLEPRFPHVPRPDPSGPRRGLVLEGGPGAFIRPSPPVDDVTGLALDPARGGRFQRLEKVQIRFRELRNGFGEPVSLAQISCLPRESDRASSGPVPTLVFCN